MEPFILSIETDAGTYQYGYHLGTIESVARNFAEDIFHKLKLLKMGTRIITVALKRNGKMIDVYDGQWSSEYSFDD